jgi:hypothetical protein
MSGAASKTERDKIAALVERYLTDYRHPGLPPFGIHHHDITSICDGEAHPEVKKPGVYVQYDEEGTLVYIGRTDNPSARHWTHRRDAEKCDRPLPAAIDLIAVSYGWETYSLEQFLVVEFPGYNNAGRWDAWVRRHQQTRLVQSSGTTGSA